MIQAGRVDLISVVYFRDISTGISKDICFLLSLAHWDFRRPEPKILNQLKGCWILVSIRHFVAQPKVLLVLVSNRFCDDDQFRQDTSDVPAFAWYDLFTYVVGKKLTVVESTWGALLISFAPLRKKKDGRLLCLCAWLQKRLKGISMLEVYNACLLPFLIIWNIRDVWETSAMLNIKPMYTLDNLHSRQRFWETNVISIEAHIHQPRLG